MGGGEGEKRKKKKKKSGSDVTKTELHIEWNVYMGRRNKDLKKYICYHNLSVMQYVLGTRHCSKFLHLLTHFILKTIPKTDTIMILQMKQRD